MFSRIKSHMDDIPLGPLPMDVRSFSCKTGHSWLPCRPGEKNSRRKDLSSSILSASWGLGFLSHEPRISQAVSGLPDGQSTQAYSPFSACQILYHFGA